MRRGLALVLVLVCCLLFVGCSGLTGSADESGRFSETVTPVPVSEPEREATLPPGVTEDGIGSLSLLVQRHRDALANRSYVWTEWERSQSVRPNESNVVVVRAERMRVESPTVYTHVLTRTRATENGTREFEQSTYADGDEWHRRTLNGSRRSFTEGPARSGRDQFAFAATFAIEQYFSVGNASVTELAVDGETVYRVRTDRPGRFNQHWSNYSAVAYVEPSGFVRRMTVSYEIEQGDTTAVVAYRFAYERRGNVSVSSPDWYDGRGNESATASG